MAKIREFNELIGAETNTAPVAGTPTDAADAVTLGYLQANYSSSTEWHSSVDDLTALKAISSADRADQQVVAVQSSRSLWQFEASSSATGDDYTIATPASGTGRWFNLGLMFKDKDSAFFNRLTFDSDFGLENTSDRTLNIKMSDGSRTIDLAADLTVPSSATVSGTNTGDASIGTFGSAPDAKGASISGQVITIQPADATHPGALSIAAQSFAGDKTFLNKIFGTITTDSSSTGAAATLATPATLNLRITNASLTGIAGLTDPSGAQFFMLHNVTGAAVNILNESGSASAVDRIITGTGSTVSLANDASLLFARDATTGRWRVVGGSGSGGTSSVDCMTVQWNADGSDAPISTTEFNNKVYLFEDGAAQNLYCTVKVPESYVAGNPIKMYVAHYHQAAAATQLLSAQSTLIPFGTAFDNTTNQRTSTNTAQSGASKVLIKAILDLTDTSGQINAVAVAAGDVIRVKLFRGTDASTSDISMIDSATEVKFS